MNIKCYFILNPEPPILEGKERLTLDCDETLVDVCQTVEAFVELLQRLVKVVTRGVVGNVGNVDNDDSDSKSATLMCRGVIVRSAVSVLSRPLAQLHLDVESPDTSSSSTCRKIADNVVKVLIQAVPNPVTVIPYSSVAGNFGLESGKKKEFDAGAEIRWSRGIGTFFFLIADCADFRSYVPSCYSPVYLLNKV